MECGNLVYDIYLVCRRLSMVEFIAVSYNINNIATTLAKFVLLGGKSNSWVRRRITTMQSVFDNIL